MINPPCGPAATSVLVATLFTALVVIPVIGVSNEADPTARYALCAEKILEATVVEAGQGRNYSTVVVTLSDHAAKEFADFSDARIGRVVEVVFDGVVLARTPIVSSITSGKLLLGKWASADAATRFVELLLDGTLRVPCGVVD